MTPAVDTPVNSSHFEMPWAKIAWFGALVGVCYGPIMSALIKQWGNDEDMGHGFFVPLIAGYIIWQRRKELLAMTPKPDWRGLMLVIFAALQMMVAVLGVDLFTSRTAIVITLIGVVWTLAGIEILKKLAFPLFLLFFMVPIPGVIYNQITFPLQILASKLAFAALDLMGIPVLREGNILDLTTQRLSVVEACSGIRSLLSLTFLSLVYGYFFEKRRWVRGLLFAATIPIAIVANGSRVTMTGLLSQFKPELAEGFFHESTGWVIFMIALGILIFFHQLVSRTARFIENRRHA
jgi:exosortase